MSEAGQFGLDLRLVHRAFERSAPVYDQHAVLQQEVEQRLMERLEYLRNEPASVLDLGCGNGFTCEGKHEHCASHVFSICGPSV